MHVGRGRFGTIYSLDPLALGARGVIQQNLKRGVGPSASALAIKTLVRLPRLPRGLPAPSRGPPFGMVRSLLISR
jgi:hypothetical protein